MKKKAIVLLFIVVALLLVLLIAALSRILERNYLEFEQYEEDYIEKYYETFNVMFNHNWNVIYTETIIDYTPSEMLVDGENPNKRQYIEWQIKYTDAYDENQIFTFNNMSTLERQIRQYISANIEKYYKEKFIKPTFSKIEGADVSVKINIGKLGWYSSTSELEQASLNVDEYVKNLETPQGAINLSEITPQNFIEKCPAYINLLLEIDYGVFSADDKELVEKAWEATVYNINDYLDNHLNIDANKIKYYNSSDHSINGVTNVEKIIFVIGMYMVNGELIDRDEIHDFDILIYEQYRGIFWP